VTAAIVEAGVYFLLLFTPFAFGGVEGWATGILQGVAGAVFVAWAWNRLEVPPGGAGIDRRGKVGAGRRLVVLWAAIALFVLLMIFQITPLPPGWIATLSPATGDLYASTFPHYREGRDSDLAELPEWLVASRADGIPIHVEPGAEKEVLHPPVATSGFDTVASARRSLSIYPSITRERLELLLSLIAVFAVVAGHFNTPDRLSRLLGVCVFSGLAISVFGILQKFDWNGKLYWVREGNYSAPFGPFVDRNTYAAFAGTILPIAICATFSARRQLGKGRSEALPLLFFHGFASVAMLGGIFYSLSRGGMISTSVSIAAVAALLLYYRGQRAELAALAGILIIGASFLAWIGPETVFERVGTLSQGQNTPSLELRIAAWGRAMDLVTDRPLFGSGLGTFPFAFMRYAPAGRSWWNIAHNEYIEVLCDSGIVGGSICLIGLVAWLMLVSRPGLFRGRPDRYTYAGLVAGIAALLLHSAVTSNLQVPANSLLLTVLGAALMNLVIRQESRSSKGDDGDAEGRRRRSANP